MSLCILLKLTRHWLHIRWMISHNIYYLCSIIMLRCFGQGWFFRIWPKQLRYHQSTLRIFLFEFQTLARFQLQMASPTISYQDTPMASSSHMAVVYQSYVKQEIQVQRLQHATMVFGNHLYRVQVLQCLITSLSIQILILLSAWCPHPYYTVKTKNKQHHPQVK